MASAVTTNASASATINSGLKRTLSSDTQDSGRGGIDNLQPATKKLKRETRLDRLKGKQKEGAIILKELIEKVLKLIKDKGIEKEFFLGVHVDLCDLILAGVELDGDALVVFRTDIGVYFASEAVLLKNLDNRMLSVEDGQHR